MCSALARPQKDLRTCLTSPKIYIPPGVGVQKARGVPEGQSDEQITAYRQTGVPSDKSGGTVGVTGEKDQDPLCWHFPLFQADFNAVHDPVLAAT